MKKPRPKNKPRCWCTAMLKPDGTCSDEYCIPEARAPGRRAIKTRATERLRDREASRSIGLGVGLVTEAAARVVPALSRLAIMQSLRSTQWRKRSGRGRRA